MSEQFIRMELKGVAKDAHENFPIRFDYSENGTAYFIGCRLVAEVDVNGNTVEQRFDIRAFGEVAEELAAVVDGTPLHVKADYGMQKNQKDGRWYNIATVTEVIDIG